MKKAASQPPFRAWLELDTKIIRHNVAIIQKLIGQAKLMAVVKSNAYGMGAPQVAHAVRSAGVELLGVGNIEEALLLEGHGIQGPFFLLEPPLPEDIQVIVEHGYIQSINAVSVAIALSEEAVRQKKQAEAHLNINTGMNRLGIKPAEVMEKIDSLMELPNLRITGVMTHFSSAGESNKTPTLDQFGKFERVLKNLQDKGITFPVSHLANSATVLDLPALALEMARVGILLYGIYPSFTVQHHKEIESAVSVKSKVAHIFHAFKGETVSYGRTWTVPDSGNLVTLPIGTSDGIPGALSSRAQVLIQGKRHPIAGRICMDLMTVYVGQEPVQIGDEVVLLGKQGLDRIGMFDWMHWGDLDPHEILTGLGGKLPKLYA